MAVIIQFRRGVAAEWAAVNPILAEGELGTELDTNLFKIGDGVTAWDVLPYAQRGLKGDTGDQGDASVVPGPKGEDSIVPGPKGDKGEDSTVPGPAGADSTVPGPAGADSTVPGPQGPGNLTYEGTWAYPVLYHVNDILKGADSLFYRCTTQHTSGVSTEPGVGASWADDWELFGGGGGGAGGGDFLVMQVFS